MHERVKRVTVMSWSLGNKKRGNFFLPFILSDENFFEDFCFISMYNEMNTFSEYTYFSYLFLKSSKPFSVSLNRISEKEKNNLDTFQLLG